MRKTFSLPIIVAGGLLATTAQIAHGQASFQAIGDLPGGRGSHANAISADGSVVVGFSYDASAAQHAMRWTQSTGVQILFPGGFGFDLISSALGISADGLTIGGWHAPTIIEEKAFIWSAAAGEQLLATRSAVATFSSDGTVGAGYVVHGQGAPRRAAIWVNGHETLIDSPGVIPSSDARAVSGDGSIVVGQAVFGTSMIRAFRWTAATGMQNIGSPDPTDFSSHADAITPDGSVIVGAMGGSGVLHPARWTAGSGWQYLAPPIGTGGSAYAVSADGNTIIGVENGRPFIWRPDRGMEDLQALISPPAGWTLTQALGISADGLVIIGNGSQVGGAGGAWIARLVSCYANCDASATAPVLTANDFQCFLNAFAANQSYANCDGSTTAPVLTANDFQCFLNSFAAGCS